MAEAEHEAAKDIYQDARHGQDVRVYPAPRKSLNNRAYDPARAASDARTEQLLKAFPRVFQKDADAPLTGASVSTSHHRNAPEGLSRK
jgi:hypothetical protein